MDVDLPEQNNEISSTLRSWGSTETLCFGDLDNDYDTSSLSSVELEIIQRNTCFNCAHKEPLDICIEIDNEWVEKNICVIVVRNTIYLKCRGCFRLFHLACLQQAITVYQLRDWTEEDFTCIHCQSS